MANLLLNAFFHSIFTPVPPNLTLPHIVHTTDPNLSNITITIPEILKELKALTKPGNKAPGPDKLHTKILKDMALI